MTYAGSNQTDRTAAGSTTFLSDRLGLSRRISGTSTIYFTRDPSGRILGIRSTPGTASGNEYFLFDGLGSVVGLTNNTGSLVASYKYDPFGKITFETSGAPFNPIRYAGYYWDSSESLYKVGLRYYDPNMSRWTQRDPAEDALDTHGWNTYVYAGDDPVNFADPNGRVPPVAQATCLSFWAVCTVPSLWRHQWRTPLRPSRN